MVEALNHTATDPAGHSLRARGEAAAAWCTRAIGIAERLFLLCPSATVHDWCRRWVVLLADAHARPQAAHRPRRLAADAVAQLHAHVCRWRAHPSAACWRTSTLVLVLVLSPSLVPVADPGGEPRTVLVGYLMNILLLLLFMRFYHATYSRSRPISVKSKSR